MNKRIREVIVKLSIILIIGLAYLIWLKTTGIMIPCLFRRITGLYCPGCGITHIFISLSNFDIKGAFAANPVMFILIPFLLLTFIDYIVKYIKYGRAQISRIGNIIIWISIVCLTLFSIIRNIYCIIANNGG